MRKHGMATSKEYKSWHHMIGRCYDKNHPQYAGYGGRGITIYPEWRESFMAFHEYMGKKPTPHHQIDRINNDGNYEPGNVRWATRLQNALNKRLRKDNQAGYKGVYFDKRYGNYRVVISFASKLIHVGQFKSLEEAANMYNQYAVQLYGSDVRLNFEYYDVLIQSGQPQGDKEE